MTREGDAVEILRNNVRNEDFPVVGIITFPNGSQEQNRWQADGRYDGSEGHDLDLFALPTKQETWGVVNKEGKLVIFYSGDGAWHRAGLYQDTFNGDKVVCITWED